MLGVFGSLDRRLEYFSVRYTDRNVELYEIAIVLRQEMYGAGKLLGYKALHKNRRQVHELMFNGTLCVQLCTMLTQLLSRKELLSSRRNLKATSPHAAQTGCTSSMVTIN